jgi:DnaJ-class molecular chaperone
MTEQQIQRKLIRDNLYIDCPICYGSGINSFVGYEGECTHCNGTGKIRKSQLKRNFKKTIL